jgi:hypothetical protein
MTMQADYDTQADALEVIVRKVKHFNGADEIDETYCHIGMFDGEAVNISLLTPADHLDLLGVAAERYGLDADELLATAQAALAAPDHLVEVSVGKSLVA